MHEISPALAPSVEIATLDVETGEVALRHDGSAPALMRRRIDAFVQALLAAPGDKMELHVEHSGSDGMYVRKLFIPKGTVLAGKIHKLDCVNVVASGDITVLTEFGCKRLTAGFTGVSPAGIQKIGYAHEDTIFINVFRTDETDITRIEAAIAGTEHLGEQEEFVCL